MPSVSIKIGQKKKIENQARMKFRKGGSSKSKNDVTQKDQPII